MDAQQGVPSDTDIDARLQTIFAAGVDEVADNVSFPVSPFHGFQAIRVDVALPESETCFVGSSQYGKFASGSFGGLYPLVSVQFGRVEDVVIFDGIDTVVALSVADAVKHVQIIMEDSSHFRLMPFELMGLGDGDSLLLCEAAN